MSVIPISRSFAGLATHAFWRNRQVPNGPAARAIAGALNHILGRRLLVHPGKSVMTPRNSGSDLRLWTTRYRASPNGTVLLAEVHLCPTDTGSSTPAWYLKVDGTSQGDQSHSKRCASGAGLTAEDRFIMFQEVTVTANALHTVDIFTKNNCRVAGWFLHEIERTALVTGVDKVVDPRNLLALGPVVDADAVRFFGSSTVSDFVKLAWDKQRGYGFAFHVDDPTSPIVPTTTATNPWDGTTTRTADTIGMPLPTQYRNRYANEYVTTTDRIPCLVWAYGERTSGSGTITVRFIGDAGSYDLTITGALGLVENAGTFLLAEGSSKDKVDVHILKDAAGTTGNVHGFGLIPMI